MLGLWDTYKATPARRAPHVRLITHAVHQTTMVVVEGGGGVLTVGYLAQAGVPPGFALVPWVGMAEATAPLAASFRLVEPMTNYMSWASPKQLMCMCFPDAPHAQRAVPWWESMHKRRPANHFSACTVGTTAAGAVLLNSAPLRYRRLRKSRWKSHMVVLSSTNPKGQRTYDRTE